MPVALLSLGQLNTPLVLKAEKIIKSWEICNYGKRWWKRERKNSITERETYTQKYGDMKELLKTPTVILIVSSNLKYERKSLQKSHERRLPPNAKSTLLLFSSGQSNLCLNTSKDKRLITNWGSSWIHWQCIRHSARHWVRYYCSLCTRPLAHTLGGDRLFLNHCREH